MSGPKVIPHHHVSRRSFIKGASAAAAGTVAAVATPAVALAHSGGGAPSPGSFSGRSAPKPIAASVEGGGPAPFDFIHWLLPGPPGLPTQVIGLEAFGLHVDPSMITDFDGFVAYAVLAGKAEDRAGNPYDVELDVRVMDGRYVGEDGETHRGTFGFF